MSYQLKIKYRQGNSIGYTTVTAEGTSESAAKAAMVRRSSSYSNVEILDVERA